MDPGRDSALAETVPTPSDADDPDYTGIDRSMPAGYVNSRLKESCADFTWPPSPEELAQYRFIEVVNGDAVRDGTDVDNREPLLKSAVPAPAATSAITAWQPTQLTAAVTESSEPLDSGRDSSLAETVPTSSDADRPPYTCIDDSTAAARAITHNDPALEGNRAAGWAAEIARLQQLIEALTEKFEWRVTNVVHT